MHIQAPTVFEKVLSPRFIKNESPLSKAAMNASIVIGICLRNQAQHISLALESALSQKSVIQKDAIVVLLDDSSEDDWQKNVGNFLKHPQVVVVKAMCGSASRARNALLDWVDAELPSARWVARLDADDRFAETNSLGALVKEGDLANALYVLGSNHLEHNKKRMRCSNIAEPSMLLNTKNLLNFIEGFGLYDQHQELPSCNLILRTHSGIRYPDVISAEDHWLVSELLMFKSHQGVIVPEPVYSVYSLGGGVTDENQKTSEWKKERVRLALAVKIWYEKINQSFNLLGVGQEGVVWRDGKNVYKQFYSNSMDDEKAVFLQQLINESDGPIPKAQWIKQTNSSWLCYYLWFDSEPLPQTLPQHYAHNFLIKLHSSGYITGNIKRTNLRIVDDQLVYIDIGKDIVPFSPERFLDAAARLYSITVLGNSDYELARRNCAFKQHEVLNNLGGFSNFYRELIEKIYPHCTLCHDGPVITTRKEHEVTLLIKCCAQDADLLNDQVSHIVTQLSYPATFATIVLLVDQYTGPYLRQFSTGDLQKVLDIAKQLNASGVVDQIWTVPTDKMIIRSTYLNWFGRSDIVESHTTMNAPLFAQLWAFDQIDTPYVMQCDCDVFIGRKDLNHDYLRDMKLALSDYGVVSVGFNIPQPTDEYKRYKGEPGEFPPEIRCGMLHLPRMKSLNPLPNSVTDNRFELMWHRSLQKITTDQCRSIRGGDSRTYYLHPMNKDKVNTKFSVWRDIVAQGLEPIEQKGKWDLLADEKWLYPRRNEGLVFLLKGRNTSIEKLNRCLKSLKIQKNQNFGLIIIDDASEFSSSWQIPLLVGELHSRTTLIRRREKLGHILNFKTAINEICTNKKTLVVTLDLDDALMSPNVTSQLIEAVNLGVDLVNGFMFRPDKPLQLYVPDYEDARIKGGGNVWAHMRGFTKELFDSLPDHYLKFQGDWIESTTDYAIMLPLSELSKKPIFLESLFCYYHQRDAYSAEKKYYQQQILNEIFAKSPANRLVSAEPASVEVESHS